MANTDPILTALAGMEERLGDRMDERFRELRLDIDGRFDYVHQRLDRLEQEYEMLKAGMIRLQADVDALRHTAERLETEIVSLRERIEDLDASLERDRSGRQDLQDQLVELRRRLSQLDSRVQSIEGRLPAE